MHCLQWQQKLTSHNGPKLCKPEVLLYYEPVNLSAGSQAYIIGIMPDVFIKGS